MIAAAVRQLRLFFIALQFFTRLPVPRWVGFEMAWLQQSSRYFPAVGVVVGGIVALTYLLCAMLWPQPVAVLLSVVAGIWVTGAFHEDGFADTCDGMGGGMTPQRVMEIMTDSRIGTYGAVGIGLLLALKCTTLSLLPPALVAPALLLAHPASRLASAALIWKLDYVKGEGKAKPLAQKMSGGEFLVGVVSVAAPALLMTWLGLLTWAALAVALAALTLISVWLARRFVRRIGGYTGDCLGAVQQAGEAAIYLALLAMAA
ncbi:adenosylcobinamide-GDP ribazoletransferase [Noviherbaspirillum aridicola]|uniref:Adenosylcobinamide-GDP ribazoletransferase n=1 Tax=Noviherbaspirillum aridicola TaxID=2849687 RepID=A0ABQ4Q559_9BURK|nr:adenosylcobinamide-GDP ribazoletransferase [Noviherbaspirillum aridicola]GIZ52132.1 adenosylcobinamide-GDP ribazoletransferase [Noviherbaspirillum aridicola]